MWNWETFLSQAVTAIVPFLTFLLIVRVASGESLLSGGLHPNEKVLERIRDYLSSYWELCDDPITWTFHEERDLTVEIEPDVFPVRDLNDVRVHLNGLDMGRLGEYFAENRRFAKDVYRSLSRCSGYLKGKRTLQEKALNKEEHVAVLASLQKEERDIHDEEIQDSLHALNRDLKLLSEENRIDQRLFGRYLPLLNGILEGYEKLESTDEKGSLKADRRKILKILTTLRSVTIRMLSDDVQKTEKIDEIVSARSVDKQEAIR